MAVTIQYQGVPIEVAVDDVLEARQKLNEFKGRDPAGFSVLVQKAAESRMGRTGLTRSDIEVLAEGKYLEDGSFVPNVEGGGHSAAQGMSGGQKFLAGAGYQAENVKRGAAQLVNAAAEKMDSTFGFRTKEILKLEGTEKLAQEELEARKIFAALDEGLGMEDAGQMFAETAFFLGGGSLALSKRLLLGAVQGSVAGALMARTEPESITTNMLAGTAAGAFGHLFVGGPKGLVMRAGKVGRKAGAATMDFFSAIAAGARGNRSLMFRMLSHSFTGADRALRNLQGVPGKLDPMAAEAATIARAMRDQAASIITGMKPRYQREVALRSAKAALDRSLTVAQRRAARAQARAQREGGEILTASQQAYGSGFPVEGGVQGYNPSEFLKQLGHVSEASMRRMGAFGKNMLEFKRIVQATEDMDLTADNVRILLDVMGTRGNVEARRLLTTLGKTRKPEVKEAVVRRVLRMAGEGVRGAGAVAGAQVPAALTQVAQ